LCERYGEALRRHLVAMLRDADAADDVLQDVLFGRVASPSPRCE